MALVRRSHALLTAQVVLQPHRQLALQAEAQGMAGPIEPPVIEQTPRPGPEHRANALQVVGWANIQRPPAGPVRDIPSLLAYGYDQDGLA